MDKLPHIGAVELGGTKCIAMVSDGEKILAERRFETRDPDDTLAKLAAALNGWNEERRFDAIGVASFGPICLDPADADYGHILKTPKPGWTGANVLGSLQRAFNCPISIETDVTAAALAEYKWGAGKGAPNVVYITIGTGLGGGIVIDGVPVRGRMHPEIGHILTRRLPGDDFPGICPFHGDCVEGLISGPALEARFGASADQIGPNDIRWDAPAHDLAQLLTSLILTVSPHKILVGGGVGMGAPHLLQGALKQLPELIAGYLPNMDAAAVQDMIMHPKLGDQAGPMGAVAVGLQSLS
ncbi:ROK family protein [Sphingorhabdus arenilitoris]|uniref:fructokinase n=1 Tax=Sphingorhabdus arenilitoris TaxID=1490041 RepID=A0ABV8RIX9_9SPHN